MRKSLLKAGKYYRTRDGRKALLEVNRHYTEDYPWSYSVEGGVSYHAVGPTGKSIFGDSSFVGMAREPQRHDLIGVWKDA